MRSSSWARACESVSSRTAFAFEAAAWAGDAASRGPEHLGAPLLELGPGPPRRLFLFQPPFPPQPQFPDLPRELPDLPPAGEDPGLGCGVLPVCRLPCFAPPAPDQDAVRGHHFAVERHVGVPHPVAVPQAKRRVEVPDEERPAEETPDQLAVFRRRLDDARQRADHALFPDVAKPSFRIRSPTGTKALLPSPDSLR